MKTLTTSLILKGFDIVKVLEEAFKGRPHWVNEDKEVAIVFFETAEERERTSCEFSGLDRRYLDYICGTESYGDAWFACDIRMVAGVMSMKTKVVYDVSVNALAELPPMMYRLAINGRRIPPESIHVRYKHMLRDAAVKASGLRDLEFGAVQYFDYCHTLAVPIDASTITHMGGYQLPPQDTPSTQHRNAYMTYDGRVVYVVKQEFSVKKEGSVCSGIQDSKLLSGSDGLTRNARTGVCVGSDYSDRNNFLMHYEPALTKESTLQQRFVFSWKLPAETELIIPKDILDATINEVNSGDRILLAELRTPEEEDVVIRSFNSAEALREHTSRVDLTKVAARISKIEKQNDSSYLFHLSPIGSIGKRIFSSTDVYITPKLKLRALGRHEVRNGKESQAITVSKIITWDLVI